MKEPIDIVLMWVDGNDPKWLKEKKKYDIKSTADGSIYRYRDWDLLRYWFRGIEKNAPWVRKVHFITWGHLPDWLDTKNPKLNIVNHGDYIPKEYLPTFNANTIENNLFRIKELSEKFILFNDDIYLIDKVKEEDFYKNGKPMETVGLNVHCPVKGTTGQYFCFNDVAVINAHFNMKKCLKDDFFKWFNLKNGSALIRTLALFSCPRFPGFYQHHLTTSLKKSTLKKVWDLEYDVLDSTSKHKFRETTDVNQWLFREWQIAEGDFEIRPNSFGKAYYIDRDGLDKTEESMLKYIRKQKGKLIAINDGPMSDKEFERIKSELKEALNSILPEKSSYEK